jgi:PadR family transcriptional regulator, regulatory protein PadR
MHNRSHRPSMGLDNSGRSRDVPIVYRRKRDMAKSDAAELLPGTLDLLILRTLVRGPNHGYGIAQRVRELSQEVFQVGESSLYPALQRLTLDGYIKPEWGVSENNRRARFYTLTAAGKKQLAAERQEFDRVVAAIRLVLDFA